MGRERGPTWLWRGGRLRALWRVLLFVLLFVALFQAQLLLVASLVGLPSLPDEVVRVLVVQGALMLSAAVVAGWLMLRWVDYRPVRELGFGLERRVPRDLAVGLALGATAMTIAVLLVTVIGAFRFTSTAGSVTGWVLVMGMALLTLALPAAAEEALFRGYLFRTLIDGIGVPGAVVITSILFTLVHGHNPNVDLFGYVNIFGASIMLSVAVLWTGSLWFASAVHLGWNWATAAALDLPVSGLDVFDAPLYDGAPVGPEWITGGVFGPEGGLVGSLAVVTGVALIRWYARPGAPGARPSIERDGHVRDR